MDEKNKKNKDCEKRKGVLIRALYFSGGFIISLWFMAPFCENLRVVNKPMFRDLKEKHIEEPFGTQSSRYQIRDVRLLKKEVCDEES